ncbi:radical SAM family heme chaperone HemW [Sphingobacterium sp. SRCM116780]|uniref:radical SAM family heme chaperone HemW n=1 Tax=Sphingobacterium sp. SRCM116780 TaxID=2907623 RepID=UPI001F41C9DE|nr:radical SAM family heme chaperone HemW [Sphingobacterium sp. SRCM116780]UIR58037.1 radical SAM family heme chaperone HemW [Sphingobacterium sp. SRCM116780]
MPFCKQACHYCDFHFSTSLKYKDEMLSMFQKEIELRSNYLEDRNVKSIYFGGGTPSILAAEDISRLIDKVSKHFDIDPDVEITLEANPDDLHREKVEQLRQTEVNRFSIGIQSFFEEDLRWMNRAHNQQEAESCIMRVQDAGFENITCDLIYGYPLLTNAKWKSNMQKLVDFQIPHISSYSMTVEKKTALDHMIKTGKAPAIDSDQAADHMLMLIDYLKNEGFEQYEISNFAKNGMYAKHNTSYWKGKHYLGIGPSAHSFNGNSRSWNIANNAKYIHDISENTLPLETENLSTHDRLNEYTMTSLRTMWGINLVVVEDKFGTDVKNQLLKIAEEFIYNKQLTHLENQLTLTDAGKLMADHIMSELFIVDDNSEYE